MTRPGSGARRWLGGILVLQLVLAAFLVVGELSKGGTALTLPGTGPRSPAFDQPVRPGDQTRRFTDTPNLPGRDDPLPDRLLLIERAGVWHLEGAIAPGDADRIARQLGRISGAVALNSPGGSVEDALRLGRAFRLSGIATQLQAGAICLSACPYLLAGGTQRTVDSTASVGVHQHYFGESTILPAFVAVENIQRGQGRVMQYLIDMGIDPRVMQHGLVTGPDDIYVLTDEQLTAYDLATDITGG